MILRTVLSILLALPGLASYASVEPDQRLFCQADSGAAEQEDEEEEEPDCD